jgi:hypothetical protein
MTPSQVKEPQISLLDKFAGMHSKFRGFFNQVQLVVRLHPHRSPNGLVEVNFIACCY